MLSNLIFR